MTAVEPITGTQGTIPRTTPRAPVTGASRPPWGNPNEPTLGGAKKPPIRQNPNPTNLLARPTASENDAEASLVTYLNQFGLGALAGWAWNEYVRLGGGQSAMQQIALDLPKQQAFQTRFPAIKLRQNAGLPPLAPADYLSYEASLDAELAAVGAPAAIRAGTNAFNDIVTKGLANDTSIAELQSRIEGGYAAVRDADPSVRNWFGQKFGVQGDHALAAYFLAPEHAETTLARMEREAEIGGAASRAGIDLGTDTANRIAAIDPSGNVDGAFQAIVQQTPLFQQAVGEHGDYTAAVQGVAAQFGLDDHSQLELTRRLQARQAQFQGGTITTTDSTGLTGTGIAR